MLLPPSHVQIQRGVGGPDPYGKSKVIWVSKEISIWTPPPWKMLDPPPPLENVGPPLKPWKIIVFFEMTIGHPSCKTVK